MLVLYLKWISCGICSAFLPSIAQVIEGYESACKKALEVLPDCVCASAKNLHDVNEAASLIRTAVTSKQYGNEDFLSNLIAQACGESAIPEPHSGSQDLYKGLLFISCLYFILRFVFQCPSSQTPEISMLITSECARFWWVIWSSASILQES